MKVPLDSLAKTAEIIGASAVVISLIYVGFQVQQNTKAVQSTVHQSLVDHVFEVEGAILTNPDLAAIIVKSESGAESLTAAERLRLETYLTFSFVNWESAYLNFQRGLMDERLWQTWDRSNYPDESARSYFEFWQKHRDWYDDSFANHVDTIFRDRGFGATNAHDSQIVEKD